MSARFHLLLDATLQHLRELKDQGIRFVSLSPESLELTSNPVLLRTPADRATLPGAPTTRMPTSTGPTLTISPAQSEPNPGTELIVPPSAAVAAALAPSPSLNSAAKAQAMADLRARAMACVKCLHLAASRKNVVFGVGDINAQLMFVGEAPGADEDEQGEPFVGKAGQLLTRIIRTMGLSRESVYIANILKCRPDTPRQAAGNRKPTAQEMETCFPYLHSQIDLIRPKVIIALGATAVEGLLGTTMGINKLRGKFQSYRGVPLMPTFHPAYLLRNEALSEKRKVWEDVLQVMEKLGLQISERQRRFFLTA